MKTGFIKKKVMYDLLIIGGGISGMVAAITAKRRGKSVIVLEKNDKIGKKLLATGNGKCNMANVSDIEGKYNTDYVYPILRKYPLKKQLDFYKSIGLLTKEVEGRIYPYSEQASSVLNALREELYNLGVQIVVSSEIKTIHNGYEVLGYKAKNVLLATGSRASFGTESGYLYEKFGHRNSELRPALVPVITSVENLKGLRGVRVKAKVKLFIDNRYVAECYDEVIFKDNGVSGTAVFNLSQKIARSKGTQARFTIDLMPEYTFDECLKIINELGGIEGIFHKEIVNNVLRTAGKELGKIVEKIKCYPLENVRLGSVELAQVMSGGLNVNDFNQYTLESKLSKGLYASGEVLDVDGECGGYNIMWAVASGMAVGENV